MYKRLTVEDKIRVPPEHLGGDLDDSVEAGLREEVEGRIFPEHELVVIGVEGIKNIEGGDIEPEDPGVHYDVEYEAIVYEPELHEIVQGEVVDVTGFGAFVRIGPFDGLCHISQIMDEYVNYDEENDMLVSEEKQYSVQNSDFLTARIIAVSMDNESANKINLTMRQPGLGKEQWIEDYEEEREEEDEGEEE